MHIQSACVSCMMDQVRKNLLRFRPDLDNDKVVDIQKQVMVRFGNLKEKPTAYHGQLIYKTLSELLGMEDPYEELKDKYNKLAEELVPKLKKILDSSHEPLLDAINIAILGNVIDFGTPHHLDLEKEVEEYSLSHLKINHFEDLKEDMDDEEKKNVMIVGDNAGEIVFDKVMLEYLMKAYPNKKYTCAVRGGPAINDATIRDAEQVGITELCAVVEGSHSPGVILEQATPEFQKAFRNAHIILSKGQGNFESLDNIETNGEVYFLLKTKCQLVADMFRVPLGSLVLYHRIDLDDFKL